MNSTNSQHLFLLFFIFALFLSGQIQTSDFLLNDVSIHDSSVSDHVGDSLLSLSLPDNLITVADSLADGFLENVNSDSRFLLSADDDSVAFQGFRKIENRAFHAGEYLKFDIQWKFIKAGTATMNISDTLFQNRSCYHIRTKAYSSSGIDMFFKVRDRVESIIDHEGLFPWKFEKHLREGNYKKDRYTLFDPYQKKAYLKRDTVEIPLYVQDVLSSFYYVRTLPLEVGKYYDIDNFSNKKVYPLRVLVHKKESVKVPAGEFNCIVVEPVLRGEGLFNQKGRLTIWMTDDERKIPVLMKSEVFIGSVDAKLIQYKTTVKMRDE